MRGDLRPISILHLVGQKPLHNVMADNQYYHRSSDQLNQHDCLGVVQSGFVHLKYSGACHIFTLSTKNDTGDLIQYVHT